MKITSTAICGSDLPLYDGFMPIFLLTAPRPFGTVRAMSATQKAAPGGAVIGGITLRSAHRILTTHAGCLQRPPAVTKALLER
ncbi:MAG: hypothetical protein ACREQ3_25780 [Candidatus Binatia bacterium]